MTDRPILFSAAMVRAILEGSKTVTRRIVRPQPPEGLRSDGLVVFSSDRKSRGRWAWENLGGCHQLWVRPPCLAGDQLWVRETWHSCPHCEPMVSYRAGGWMRPQDGTRDDSDARPLRPKCAVHKWRPSIFMPRSACRILLEVVSVRAERLHAIDDRDALREGITIPTGPHLAHCEWRHPELDPDYFAREVIEFACLWDAINAKRGFPWSSNPWVWRIEFKRIHTEGTST